MMTDQEFVSILEEIVALGHETTGTECKPAGPRTDRALFTKMVRAVLGMSNRRDGGRVIIGIQDTTNALTPIGLNDTDLATWNYDHVSDGLKEYADPSVSFDLETKQYQGKNYIVLTVTEFANIPILCKRQFTLSGAVILKEGACYMRSRRKPETTEVSTQEDMRDLLGLATEKRLRRYLLQAQRAGVALVPLPSTVTPLAEARPDQELFDNQLGDLT